MKEEKGFWRMLWSDVIKSFFIDLFSGDKILFVVPGIITFIIAVFCFFILKLFIYDRTILIFVTLGICCFFYWLLFWYLAFIGLDISSEKFWDKS